jgi:hypothetical protein
MAKARRRRTAKGSREHHPTYRELAEKLPTLPLEERARALEDLRGGRGPAAFLPPAAPRNFQPMRDYLALTEGAPPSPDEPEPPR